VSKSKRNKNELTKFTDIDCWSTSFLAEAQKEGFKEIARHIDYLNLGAQAENFLDTSLLLVDFACSSIQEKGLSAVKFLNQQKYRLAGFSQTLYCLTIEITPNHCGRIICDHKFSRIDLVDLHQQAWYPYKAEGFERILISRIDGKKINDDEMQRIKRLVEKDFYFDYEPRDTNIQLSYFDELHADTIVLTVSHKIGNVQLAPAVEPSDAAKRENIETDLTEEFVDDSEPIEAVAEFLDLFEELDQSVSEFETLISGIKIFADLESACEELRRSVDDLKQLLEATIEEGEYAQEDIIRDFASIEEHSFASAITLADDEMICSESDDDEIDNDLTTLIERLWRPSHTLAWKIYHAMLGA
jgi:hypothetical protein